MRHREGEANKQSGPDDESSSTRGFGGEEIVGKWRGHRFSFFVAGWISDGRNSPQTVKSYAAVTFVYLTLGQRFMKRR